MKKEISYARTVKINGKYTIQKMGLPLKKTLKLEKKSSMMNTVTELSKISLDKSPATINKETLSPYFQVVPK